MDISGTPLNDSYHFGQTLINDYGRPYWQGVNNVTGFSTSANDGRFAFYVDGEYQYAPTIPGLSAVGAAGHRQCRREPAAAAHADSRQPVCRLQDTYAMMKYAGMDWSVGKQSMWWGPGESGALLMSNNAAPFWMLQINRMEPMNIPGLSKFLGPFEFCQLLRRARRPLRSPRAHISSGRKISFKPTENLEFGFTRNDVFGGQGHVPITFGSFWNAFTSINDVSANVKFSRNDPGARHASFDFSYRLPFVRRWLTLYTDSLVHDDVSPVSAPRRSAINPGIYLTHFPGIPKLDFRAEAVYTDPPTVDSMGGHFIYWEVVYHDAYLNGRNIMGSWVGREGKGYQAWSTYHLSPKSSIQVSVRNSKIADDFIPGGSTQWDWNVSAVLWARKDFEIQPFLQYETWWVPVLAPTRQADFTTSIQLTWWPSKLGIRRATY